MHSPPNTEGDAKRVFGGEGFGMMAPETAKQRRQKALNQDSR